MDNYLYFLKICKLRIGRGILCKLVRFSLFWNKNKKEYSATCMQGIAIKRLYPHRETFPTRAINQRNHWSSFLRLFIACVSRSQAAALTPRKPAEREIEKRRISFQWFYCCPGTILSLDFKKGPSQTIFCCLLGPMPNNAMHTTSINFNQFVGSIFQAGGHVQCGHTMVYYKQFMCGCIILPLYTHYYLRHQIVLCCVPWNVGHRPWP